MTEVPGWVLELRDIATVSVPFGDYQLHLTYDDDGGAFVEVTQGEQGDWHPIASGYMPWAGVMSFFGTALARGSGYGA